MRLASSLPGFLVMRLVEQPTHLYFTAVDPSADLFAREVMEVIQRETPETTFRSTGGPHMATRSEMSSIDTGALNVLGFWEGIMAYRSVVQISDAIAADVVASRPDALVMVDAWGLSLRVARKVRKLAPDIPLLKLIGPQVWASRPGRARTLSATVDYLMCIHDFEEQFYEPYGLPTTVIGHPALSRATVSTADTFARDHGLKEGEPFVLVLPGSRPAEIRRVAEPLVEAAKRLVDARPGLRVFVAPAPGVGALFDEVFATLPKAWVVLRDETQHAGAMAAATVALTCSGTVNNEVAVQGTPIVTGYKVGAISWALMNNFLLTADYVTLLNMAAGREIVPELLQHGFTPQAIAKAAAPLLDDPRARKAQVEAQNKALLSMGFGDVGAAEKAGAAILKFLSDARSS